MLPFAQQVFGRRARDLRNIDFGHGGTGSDAERLYARLGWSRVGVIPGYALWPDGTLCGTTYFYKAMD